MEGWKRVIQGKGEDENIASCALVCSPENRQKVAVKNVVLLLMFHIPASIYIFSLWSAVNLSLALMMRYFTLQLYMHQHQAVHMLPFAIPGHHPPGDRFIHWPVLCIMALWLDGRGGGGGKWRPSARPFTGFNTCSTWRILYLCPPRHCTEVVQAFLSRGRQAREVHC